MKKNAVFTISIVWVCLCGCLVSLGHLGAEPINTAGTNIDYILNRIQERYDVVDFEADFSQESYLGAMDIIDTARGHVSFRPPDAMRWEYETPEQYTLILNADRIWLYWPDDNQVMVGNSEDYLGHTELGEFFSEPGRLMENFDVEMADRKSEEKNRYALKLTPKQRNPNLEKAFLMVSKDTFLILETIVFNTLGDETRIRFSNVRFNQDIDPRLFNFEIPKDAQVLQLEPQ